MNENDTTTQIPGMPGAAAARPMPVRKSTVGHWIAIILLLLLLGTSMLANIVLVIVSLADVADVGGSSSGRSFSEEYVEGGGKKKVVEIDVSGVISFEGGESLLFKEEDMASRIIREIDTAADDDDVVAILLMVDSPGGGVTASDIIYEKLLKFKSSGQGNRKVVALMRDLAASGGYYVSAAADKIVAHRTTITGSIGVLISMANFKGLGDKLGIKDVTIKSGKNKDMLNPLREATAEETNILQGVVNDMYERFVSIVARSRGIESAKIREIADGRIYTATQALELNLLDEVGNRDEAVNQLKKLTGAERLKIVRYKQTYSLVELLSSRLGTPMALPVPARWKAQAPQFLYLWQPEL